MKRYILSGALAMGCALTVSAQSIRPGYVDWGVKGSDFPAALQKWTKGQKWTEDDNFFISRVKPKQRFRNIATQVNTSLDDSNDKKLIFWVPINNQEFNALPDGVFDSEVFPMWSYVTHYGNWSTPLVRIPGGFSDVAHKNGVPVSSVASIPYGYITPEWEAALAELGKVSPEKLSDYLIYYGVDGIGYNSEFEGDAQLIKDLMPLHHNTVKLMKEKGNPLTEFIWYDGTDTNGEIHFDAGLNTHNVGNWGTQNYIRTSLFFNYNWNRENVMNLSVNNAKKYGRTPLDLYCGINMQGREPAYFPEIWPLLAKYPLSIGLWGAHSQNMFFEGREANGSNPDKNQKTYLDRVLRWFTGSTRNPVNTPGLTNSLIHGSETADFFGMSKMMSARSALKWNLSDEPFISYFNLGNGKFFNYKGERQHNSEWYNIGIQDYLPTWMWWFSRKFMGREANDVAQNGLKGDFVWDDAYMGGSSMKIYGTSADEYLHLFKTEFEVKDGDVITLRYKVVNGKSDAALILSLKGEENKPLGEKEFRVMHAVSPMTGRWVEKSFTVGADINIPAGKEVAMIALHFQNASDLDLRLGEFSIVRKSDMKQEVATPQIEKSELLAARNGAVDGKIIFNMPNDKGNDVCYNIDVNTSLFRLWAQQENEKPVMMGMTPSWAGLLFSIPVNNDGSGKVRLGVSALNLDGSSESEIAWSDYYDFTDKYEVSDEIEASVKVLHPGETFSVGYTDPRHAVSDWAIFDKSGKRIAESKGTLSLNMAEGIDAPGMYDLTVDNRRFQGYIQIIGEEQGAIPSILEAGVDNANPETEGELLDEGELKFKGTKAYLAYRADKGEGTTSRGLRVGEKGLGFRWADSGMNPEKSFSVSFWFKPESFSANRVHMLNIRDNTDSWPVNNWGYFWHTLKEDGTSNEFALRLEDGENLTYKFTDLQLSAGRWYHLAYVFETNEAGEVLPSIFVNGEKKEVSSWSVGDEEQSGAPTFAGRPKEWRENNILALGGYIHKNGSVAGNVDNFMVWEKALTAEEVVRAMGNVSANDMEGLTGYFDFETDPDDKGLFENQGSGSFKAGVPGFESTEVEGQSSMTWYSPQFCSGSPYVEGKGSGLKTEVIWDAPGAEILAREDEDDGGSIVLKYTDYDLNQVYSEMNRGLPVRLTLRNEYGEDSREMELRLGFSGVEGIVGNEKELKVTPVLFDSFIDVTAPCDGRYRLTLHSLDGRNFLINEFAAQAGEGMRIYPDVEAGIYILSVELDGKAFAAKRVVRK